MERSNTLAYRITSRERGKLVNFAYWIPETYDPAKKYPMFVFFHGAGEKGTEHMYLQSLKHSNMIERILSDPELKENFIILAPQCPEFYKWVNTSPWRYGSYDFENTPQAETQKEAADKIIEFTQKYSVDMDRIYVTGLSMGGYCTWDILARYPDLFAAAIPVCGGMDEKNVDIYKNIPLWIIHGADDRAVSCRGSRRIYAKLILEGAEDVHYTEYLKIGHGSWVPAYKDEEIFQWLITRRKKHENE